jgi:trehalose 6-phosphate synthase complex regulatory subunit
LDDRFIQVTSSPIGIDLAALEKQISHPQVTASRDFLRQKYENKKLIVSRDKFDRIKGLKPKMQAYERFLHDHPEWVGKVSASLVLC